MDLTIDFETRSPVDLKDRGLFVYFSDPLTEIMCLGYAIDNNPAKLLIPDKFLKLVNPENLIYEIGSPAEVIHLIQAADRIIAHNSMFEYVGWNKKFRDILGWPVLPMAKVYDTMAQCAYHALPLNLDSASSILNLAVQKDKEGHRVMMKLCKPRQAWKREKANDPEWMSKIYWHEARHELEILFNYCGKDVETERLLFHTLPKLPANERAVWLLDQKINLAGIPIDMESVKILTSILEKREAEQQGRFAVLTDGKVSGPRSYVALKDWINEKTGLNIQSVSNDAVTELLERDNLPTIVSEVLKIKAELAKSSTAKFKGMVNRASADNRVRGATLYHGAATGRFAGRGIQFQNLPRDSYGEDDYHKVMEYIITGQDERLKEEYDDPFFMASKCIRGSVKAATGKQFLNADYSSIEGVGLAWAAGEEWVLNAYRSGSDMYKVAAAMILNKPYDSITDKERQSPGKIAELACGYGGSIAAVRQFGGTGTDEEIYHGIVAPWREIRPETTKFWRALESAAMKALKNPGTITSYRAFKYTVNSGFLKCKLPSGRVLHYFRPDIREVLTPWGEYKKSITYIKTDGGGPHRVPTHGGKLVENVIQALCRDLLVIAMLNLDRAGFKIILTVHDEIMVEVDKGDDRLEEMISIMSIVPSWAAGMPIKADGWIGERFRK